MPECHANSGEFSPIIDLEEKFSSRPDLSSCCNAALTEFCGAIGPSSATQQKDKKKSRCLPSGAELEVRKTDRYGVMGVRGGTLDPTTRPVRRVERGER